MKLNPLLFLTCLLTSTSLIAATPLVDSVGIENNEGKKVILHKLDPKETYFALSRRYGIKPADIQKFNNNKALKIGDIVKVPTERSFVETTKPAIAQQPKPVVTQPATQPVQQPVQQPTQTNPQTITQQYKVSAGETLYAIAKRFNTTVEDITKLNKLTSTALSPGQIIQVKTNSADIPAPAPIAVADNTAVKRDSPYVNGLDSAERKIINAGKFGLFEKNEKGVATWIEDTSLDPSKKLVLHRIAPIGTVIKITNPMTNRTSFAKVVGRFTENEANKDVILIMTKNVAESIGAIDKRIHVNISYGSPNE
ncbi:LysM peptidoglycan-binding domain-containing protein [Mucilaginibacter antarcticus]|uniref:LysM peptidoglycan-binding domain-containing protein n=1 Tax=Mucilaginibacter antarcticus TaxID=1855725 RepID=A0ABW5XMQ2_9SPHI